MPVPSINESPSGRTWRSTGTQQFESIVGTCRLAVVQDNPLQVRLTKLAPSGQQTIQIDFGVPLQSDVYIRENDLVFTGEETENSPVRTQAYIRAVSDEAACDLILSRQTSLLDYAAPISLFVPSTEKTFRLLDGQLVDAQSDSTPGENVVLAAPIDDELAICLMYFPGDADEIVVSENQLAVQSFAAALEKGVIRQVRVRALFAERDGLAESLAAKYEAFRQSELPLTT
ncbi:hypothetical protein LOC68_00715 [Blastopirellula sp. JC732]|uniref:Uncharacterized protein n=1 Tax=Blastopirellula sediminis TaxID=2894196 RepID=A0A9X1MHK9_9BACT|nr:hypothetical protein [Blastopirellula sediminis]MCC9604396.1 hypothetical protein [Blastopirellula sediminis]MCC9626916.1 hypothetical protein [Blastopirellula sediminis]